MNPRIKDKLNEIDDYLSELSQLVPEDYESYLENFGKRAACERYFEKIVEAVIDVCFLIIKEKKFELPREEETSFLILAKKGLLPEELANKLVDAKGMRNFIVHEYGEIDNLKVYTSLTEEFESDIKEFLNSIRNTI